MDPLVDAADITPAALTPTNPPGQSVLAYRIGTHATFWRRLLDRLRAQTLPSGPHQGAQPLAALTTRDPDDPAIALLDAWAMVADVITFYQERIANEAYLRTATERRSVLELARMVGYELTPGVAASAFLAFTVEDAPGAPAAVTVPQGTKLQSIPSQGQLPQTFETSAEFVAHAEWNALRPQLQQPQQIGADTRTLSLRGSTLNLKSGDVLLLRAGQTSQTVHIQRVTIDTQALVTCVELADAPLPALAGTSPQVLALRARAGFFGHNAPLYASLVTTTAVSAPPGTAVSLRQYTNYQVINAFTQAGSGLLTKAGLNAEQLARNFNVLYNGADLAELTQLTAEERARVAVALSARVTIALPSAYPGDWDANDGHSIWTDSQGRPYTESDVYLERSVPEVVSSSWVVLACPATQTTQAYQVEAVTEVARVDYATSARVTGLKLKPTDGETALSKPEALKVRKTTAYVQSEELELAEQPLATPVQGDTLTLDHVVLALPPGRMLIVSGRRTRARIATDAGSLTLTAEDGSPHQLKLGDVLEVLEPPALWAEGSNTARALSAEELIRLLQPLAAPALIVWKVRTRTGTVGTVQAPASQIALLPSADTDPVVSEVAVVASTTADTARSTIILRDPLRGSYDRATVTISANIVRATHGETVANEAVGSGNGAQANQRFRLSRPPPTYVPAPTASGATSTLTVRVNGVQWYEVPALYGLSPRDQVYSVRHDDAGNTLVIFGDGSNGARLPTGQENIIASYRSGIGLDGNVGAGALSLLQTRPLGIRAVVNPLPATGGAPPETLASARDHVPRAVLTLERIVTQQDYEDFAHSFAGIGKAQAALLWTGTTRLIHLTIADAAGNLVDRTSDLYTALVGAIQTVGNPLQGVQVDSYVRRLFNLAAHLWVDARYDRNTVMAMAREAVVAAFAFAPRAFGQDVTAAEVITVLQRVPGIVAVDLDALYRSTDAENRLNTRLEAQMAQVTRDARGNLQIQPAELLLINTTDSAGITITGLPV